MHALRVFLLTAMALEAPAAAAAEIDWSKAQVLTVTAKNYKFMPKHLKLRQGIAYRLHIENTGSETHEFNAAKLFRNSDIGDLTALNSDHTEPIFVGGRPHYLTRDPLTGWVQLFRTQVP